MSKQGILNGRGRFPEVFSSLIEKSGVTCYQIHEFTDIDEGYLSRLRNGLKQNPGPEVVVKIGLALAHYSQNVDLFDIEELLNSTGYTLKLNLGIK